MRIINTDNPARGCANFVLLCDHCGREIGGESANIEFSHLGEAYCLHKACSDAFRRAHGKKLFWVELKNFRMTTSELLTDSNIDLLSDG